jgi:hypothetical protein
MITVIAAVIFFACQTDPPINGGASCEAMIGRLIVFFPHKERRSSDGIEL